MALPVNCHCLKKAASTTLPSQLADIAPIPALYCLQQVTGVALPSSDGFLAGAPVTPCPAIQSILSGAASCFAGK